MSMSTRFRIRLVGGASASIGVGVEAMTMDIWDPVNDRLCVYELRGLSWGAGTPVALAFRGPWNAFETRQPMACDSFGGLANFGTLFVMDKSVNVLTISPFGRFPVEIAPFATGWSIGFGAAVGGGAFTMMFPPISARAAAWPHNVDDSERQ